MQKSEPLEASIAGRCWLEMMRVFRYRDRAAEILNIAPATITNYRMRKTDPRASILAVMAEHGCDIMWIITGVKTNGQPV